MTATTAAGGADASGPTVAAPGGPARWPARLLAVVLGAVLGMAVGHAVAWRTAQPLPDDPIAREIASRFVGDEPGTLSRDGAGWERRPAGWRGALFGYRVVRASEIRVSFPATADSPHVQHAHVVSVAEALRQEGWQRVTVDEFYPALVAHRAGWEIRYGPVLGDPPADPDIQPDVLGADVTIRSDTPASAPLGLLLGGLIGGLVALGLAVLGQRAPPGRRRPAVVLFAIGVALLAPGTLAALGLLYVFLTDDLPQEPLWFAYGSRFTRVPTILAAAFLLAALLVGLRPRLRSQDPPLL